MDNPQVTKKGVAAAKKASGNSAIEELLDAIVPPKSYSTDDGSLWQQRISATPATKMDVTRLHELLDQQLLQKQARETGVCPVREGLYREAFGASLHFGGWREWRETMMGRIAPFSCPHPPPHFFAFIFPALAPHPLSLAFVPPPPHTDEVIRQTAVNSGERGTLLLRVRNEIRMRVSAYQALYESSIAYGMRKALLAEQKRGELQASVRCTSCFGSF